MLRRALLEEILLVTLAHVLFLWHFRSILIVTIPLPAAIPILFLLMNGFGITSNIMSLAGITIAIGVAPSRVQAKPYLEVIPDRFLLAQYGLSMRDVLDYVEVGIGGVNLGTTIEGRERLPIQLRLQSAERNDIEHLGAIPIRTRSGATVPLGQLAKIQRTIGPGEIASENGRLRLSLSSAPPCKPAS